MKFAILHVSDLHRDLDDELNNEWLLESLARDLDRHASERVPIIAPSLCIVTGDLVYGVPATRKNVDAELLRQYEQAEEFLVGLADRFFGGQRDRIIIVPGNHDVCFPDVMASCQRVEDVSTPERRRELARQLHSPSSRLRWSWSDLAYYEIIDCRRYENRFRHFADAYGRFYEGRRTFSLEPARQWAIFDYADLQLSVLSLNSCHNNDPMRRSATLHPGAVAEAFKALGSAHRTGWLVAGAWHHGLIGAPGADDCLDMQVIQQMLDFGLSLGFHGHQHVSGWIDERYRLGPEARKMVLISSGTLCAAPQHLAPGIPRSFNVVQVDTEKWIGRVHQRRMVNHMQSLPAWGPGSFPESDASYVEFEISPPNERRPQGLTVELQLQQAADLVGNHQWSDAVSALAQVSTDSRSRPLLVRALEELNDAKRTMELLYPPETSVEAVMIGGAILDEKAPELARRFCDLPIVKDSLDASVREIASRIRERLLL